MKRQRVGQAKSRSSTVPKKPAFGSRLVPFGSRDAKLHWYLCSSKQEEKDRHQESECTSSGEAWAKVEKVTLRICVSKSAPCRIDHNLGLRLQG